MRQSYLYRISAICLVLQLGLVGCGHTERSYYLDEELARSSVEEAMQAWIDGQTPDDLKPNIIVGDSVWANGKKLTAFQILPDEEMSDGSNLYVHVKRTFVGGGEPADATVTYVVGTSPVVTIFPQ